MPRKQAFTLIELLVVISIIALLVGILLPALAAARRTARQMTNSTQVRGVHQSMIMFSENNGGWYPGVAIKSGLTPKVLSDANFGAGLQTNSTAGAIASGDGDTPVRRFRDMLDDRLFDGPYLISPSEVKEPFSSDTSATMTTANFSYALLNIVGIDDAVVTNQPVRTDEWRNTGNGMGVVISDRAISSDAPSASGSNTYIKSVHTDPASNAKDWKGSIGYNDNHVEFEPKEKVDTVYGSERKRSKLTSDNLFTANETTTGYAATGADAAMVWANATDYVDETGVSF